MEKEVFILLAIIRNCESPFKCLKKSIRSKQQPLTQPLTTPVPKHPKKKKLIFFCHTATKQQNTMSSLTSYPRIGYPAPHFEGEAVVNGEFKHISLKDYKGE